MKRVLLPLALVLLMALAAPASATETPVAPWGWDGQPTGLTVILNTLYGQGNYVRVNDDNDQLWPFIGASCSAQAKYAGYTQDFGYIPGASGGSFHHLFTVTGNGYLPDSPAASFSTASPFRFADDPSGAPLWTSLVSDNAVSYCGTYYEDHMVTWQITGNAGHPGNVIGNFVICWEDLRLHPRSGCDFDYNDLVVEVAPAPAVPEPCTLLLVGGGLLGLAGLRRKFRK